jgi:hypothetical protein
MRSPHARWCVVPGSVSKYERSEVSLMATAKRVAS